MFEKFWKALEKYEFKIRFLDKLNDPNSPIYLGADNEWNNFFNANPNWIKENPKMVERLIAMKWEQFGEQIKKLKEVSLK